MRIALCVRWTVLFILLASLSARSEDDSIAKRLEEAKSQYTSVMAQCRDDVLSYFDEREKAARSRGDKAELDRLAKVRAEFESSRQLPGEAPRAVKTRAERAALKLTRAFETVVREYVRDNNDPAATAVQKESKVYFRPADAVELDGSYYKVIRDPVSWENAYVRCIQMKGHLVVIRSKEENEFVARIAKDAGIQRVWIGLSDKAQEGRWVWVDGDSVAYSKWHRWPDGSSEPNDYRGEDYASLSAAEAGDWHDVPNVDSKIQGFVCEWD